MTTGYGAAPGAVPPAGSPPAQVAEAAQRRKLGAHLAFRSLPVPSGPTVIAVLLPIGLVVMGCVLLGVARQIETAAFQDAVAGGDSSSSGALFWLVRGAAGASCLGAIPAFGRMMRVLGRKPESFHLYEGGVVHFDGGYARAVPWSEIRGLRPVVAQDGGRAGQVTSYLLDRHSGAPLELPAAGGPGMDPFLDQLVWALRARGIEVR